jgi:metal-responsive CopG/Arc/MetJ family transcriptional regulator
MDPPVARTGGAKSKREATIGVRLTPDALAYIDKLAEKEERTRSDMIRVLLRVGMEHRQ